MGRPWRGTIQNPIPYSRSQISDLEGNVITVDYIVKQVFTVLQAVSLITPENVARINKKCVT